MGWGRVKYGETSKDDVGVIIRKSYQISPLKCKKKISNRKSLTKVWIGTSALENRAVLGWPEV